MAAVARSPSDGGKLANANNTICCGKIKLREWTIKNQIELGMYSISALLLIVLTLVSVVTVLILGGNTRAMASNSLEYQIRTNAYNFSDAYAKEISQTLLRRASAVSTIAQATAEAYYATDWEFTASAGNNSWYCSEIQKEPHAKAVKATDGSSKVGYSTIAVSSYYIPKTSILGDLTGCSKQEDYTFGEDSKCYSLFALCVCTHLCVAMTSCCVFKMANRVSSFSVLTFCVLFSSLCLSCCTLSCSERQRLLQFSRSFGHNHNQWPFCPCASCSRSNGHSGRIFSTICGIDARLRFGVHWL